MGINLEQHLSFYIHEIIRDMLLEKCVLFEGGAVNAFGALSTSTNFEPYYHIIVVRIEQSFRVELFCQERKLAWQRLVTFTAIGQDVVVVPIPFVIYGRGARRYDVFPYTITARPKQSGLFHGISKQQANISRKLTCPGHILGPAPNDRRACSK